MLFFCDDFALVSNAVFVELRYLLNKTNHLDSASAIDTEHPVTFRITFEQKWITFGEIQSPPVSLIRNTLSLLGRFEPAKNPNQESWEIRNLGKFESWEIWEKLPNSWERKSTNTHMPRGEAPTREVEEGPGRVETPQSTEIGFGPHDFLRN